ncbi:hypothetical protein GIY23_10095 [Allosaccharopolyspora coralli]|uniref:VOC domain-containing protein n=1 Tax=Allosaccharopolyspora coralli TaxID=2665642 RepID=A0A5Q3Q5S8_9PSEU|nr:VOC family protein [Allosaccharopolyspora coralli]QGK69822.1 hypothetical protein GIY23_10095 [Allosaccharopolyspora coralli]
MPSHPPVRGLRCAELTTSEFDSAVRFHERLFGWTVLQTESGVDCWVGERRSARIRSAKSGEARGWRLVFAGADQDVTLAGPDDTTAWMARGRAQHGPWAPAPRDGEPCWLDLAADEVERADSFWTETLNWRVENDTYTVAGRAVAGRAPSGTTVDAGWVCYVGVRDLDATVGRVEELGGRVLDKLEHPVLGSAVVFADPSGAVLGLTATTKSWGS